MLVLDASTALFACSSREGFAIFGGETLVAPPLLWSEARSALHEMVWRGATSRDQAVATLARLATGRIRSRSHARLGAQAWQIADDLGLAKTYDAEYVALALLLRCRLVTVDEGLRRGAARLDIVIGPREL